MRELSSLEVEDISGAIGPLGFGLGFAAGFGGGLIAGHGWQGALVTGFLAGASAGTAGLAGVAFGAGRVGVGAAWGARSVGLGAVSGAVGSSGSVSEERRES